MQPGHDSELTVLLSCLTEAQLCSHLLPQGPMVRTVTMQNLCLFHWAEILSPAALDFPLLKFDTGTFGIRAAAA